MKLTVTFAYSTSDALGVLYTDESVIIKRRTMGVKPITIKAIVAGRSATLSISVKTETIDFDSEP